MTKVIGTNFNSEPWSAADIAALRQFFANPGANGIKVFATMISRSIPAVETKARKLELIKRPRTHCKRGHEFTEDNTYWRSNGCRMCKACNSSTKAPITHCKRGHELEGENIYRPADGRRICRSCKSIFQKAYKSRLRAESVKLTTEARP